MSLERRIANKASSVSSECEQPISSSRYKPLNKSTFAGRKTRKPTNGICLQAGSISAAAKEAGLVKAAAAPKPIACKGGLSQHDGRGASGIPQMDEDSEGRQGLDWGTRSLQLLWARTTASRAKRLAMKSDRRLSWGAKPSLSAQGSLSSARRSLSSGAREVLFSARSLLQRGKSLFSAEKSPLLYARSLTSSAGSPTKAREVSLQAREVSLQAREVSLRARERYASARQTSICV